MSDLAKRHGISAFELFCAYHLGITADGGYRFQNVHDVAKRFGCPSGVIKQLLADFGLDPDAVIQSTYDVASAQVDIMTAPEGISRRELATVMWEEFQKAPRRARNWTRELAEDARANEQTYGASRGGGSGGGGGSTGTSGGPRSPDRGTPGGSAADRGTRRGPRS